MEIQLKQNWKEIDKLLSANGIECFYHFTDYSNLGAIEKYRGLYSWDYCEKNGIIIPKPGGDKLSRSLDTKSMLENYVRLSFVSDHPMSESAKKDERRLNPILLRISKEVAFWKTTKFYDSNATYKKSKYIYDKEIASFSSIRFNLFKKRYNDLDVKERKLYQAEILVKEKIPIDYIIDFPCSEQ